ncbi:uncharacterized protein CG3556 [Anabrus simplex]|uniref:uncharacterized protein CG3556 n=1 Tax=Anabrus simplex TaxID=316456 RepID=UPI0034DD3A56
MTLANGTWYSPANKESLLVAKQVELEVVIHLWRHHESPLSAGRLAQYTLALNAICRDPKKFYGHDLINMLQHHEAELDYEFAFSTLAVCSSGAHVRKRQIRRLLDITEKINDHNVDTLSMVLLALSCIVRDHRNRNLDQYVRKPSVGLAQQQLEDGSFGNIHSTALAIQALEAGDEEASAHWNRSSAVNFLLNRQSSDGSFSDLSTTAEVILALGPRSLSGVRDMGCPMTTPISAVNFIPVAATEAPQTNLEGTNLTLESLAGTVKQDLVSVTYTIWVHTNISEQYTLGVRAERNTTFYNVMLLAAQQDPHYQFEATEWPNGHYVHTLAGYKEEPTAYYFWLLYQTPELPEPSNPPGNQLITPVGVDGLLVDEGNHYLFWYKKL